MFNYAIHLYRIPPNIQELNNWRRRKWICILLLKNDKELMLSDISRYWQRKRRLFTPPRSSHEVNFL